MTPRGRLDERCFTDWLKGCVVLIGMTLVLAMVGFGVFMLWVLFTL